MPVWTPQDVEAETIAGYWTPEQRWPQSKRLNAWNRAVVLGGEHYKAWRSRHIAPIENRGTALCRDRVWKRELEWLQLDDDDKWATRTPGLREEWREIISLAFQRVTLGKPFGTLSEASELAKQKRREEEEAAELAEHDRRYFEQELLRAAQLVAREEQFFNDLARTPAMEDAILHVQKVLGCDRETARQEMRKRFFG
jgi:hypothetical protein